MRKILFGIVIFCFPFLALADGPQSVTLTNDIVSALKQVMTTADHATKDRDESKKPSRKDAQAKVYYFEFFDVHCPYCKARDVAVYAKLQPLYYVNFAFLGPNSEAGTELLEVAKLKGKERQVHAKIMTLNTPLDESEVQRYAKKYLSLMPAAYQKMAQGDEVSKALANNGKLIDELNLPSVPAILIVSRDFKKAILWTGPFEDEDAHKILPEFTAAVKQVA